MRCAAETKAGRRCSRPALPGSELCHAHSGARVGRPPALTPEVHAKIVQLVKAGCPGEVAARAAGISATTYYASLKQGVPRSQVPSTSSSTRSSRRAPRPTATR